MWRKLLGVGEYAARLLPAILGTLGVLGIFFLGKELFSDRVGVTAALISAVLPFHIYYSREVRNYSLLFFLCTLSFLYFIKALKTRDTKNTILYVATTVSMLYTHYFGLYVFGAQILYVFLSFLFAEVRDRRIVWKTAALSFLPVFFLYIPWVSTVRRLAARKDFWIEKPSADFIVGYFKSYFGNETFVAVVILFLIAIYFIGNTRQDHFHDHRSLLLTWTLVVFMAPYIQSHILTPILYPRFTIVALPAILLMAGRGIEELKDKKFKSLVLMSLVIALCFNIFFSENRFYSVIKKEQWREASLYIFDRDPSGKYPVCADRLIEYYFHDLYRSDRKIHNPIDSLERAEFVLKQMARRKIPGFWLIQAHKPMKDDIRQFLERSFRIENNRQFRGIQVFLYLPKRITKDQCL
jgi:uncharacterized membrane protein